MPASDFGRELKAYIQDMEERVDRIQQHLVPSEEDNLLKSLLRGPRGRRR